MSLLLVCMVGFDVNLMHAFYFLSFTFVQNLRMYLGTM